MTTGSSRRPSGPRSAGGLAGEATLLLVDLTLQAGLRFGETTALRPVDVVAATATDAAHVWIRRSVTWPGRAYSTTGGTWEVKEPKGRRYRKIAISPDLYAAVAGYIDRWSIEPEALVFDAARLRAEHVSRRAADPLPARFPHGRYLNAETGRSGEHGRYSTYDIGCRCPHCRNAYTEYRFWRARLLGRQSAQPWLEPGFIEARRGRSTRCPICGSPGSCGPRPSGMPASAGSRPSTGCATR